MIRPGPLLVDRLLHEDVPYLDLTTHLLGIGDRPATITFVARDAAVAAGTDVVGSICARLGVGVLDRRTDGARVEPGDVLLRGTGTAADVHAAWKVCANVLEGCCGIATRTRALVDAARSASPGVRVFTTRKNFPGTKELAVAAILAGGALPHRLGLSETVLIFDQHTAFIGGASGLAALLGGPLRGATCEKKILAEVTGRDEALLLAAAGVDGLQFDKVPPDELATIVASVRAFDPRITLIAAGGINPANAGAYAATGVDALASSWMYAGRPADVGVTIEPA